MRGRHLNKTCLVISGLLIVTFGLWIYYNKEFSKFPTKVGTILGRSKEKEVSKAKEVKMTTIGGQSCKIPELNPFDESVLKHIGKPLPYKNCPSSKVFFEANFLADQPSIKQIRDLKEWGPCCFKRLLFQPKHPYRRKTMGPCKELLLGETNIPQEYEYVQILCGSNSTQDLTIGRFHEEILNFIPVKESPYNRKEKRDHPSVLLVGFDHQSRMNFLRQMPKSYEYMMEELGAIEMLGFNKIGDNTFNNTNAFLMGLSFEEIRKSCWKTRKDFFDSCPFIWKDFAQNGYLTSYSDDYSNVYSYRFKGFENQPTDYYTHPIISSKHHPHFLNGNCFGTQPRLLFLHDYIKKTAWALRNKPYFHFAYHSSTSPVITTISQIDNSFQETLSFLNSSKLLDETIVLLISDHGWRFGKMLHEYQGRLENRLPFAYFIFPPWFKKKYPDAVANLNANANRLTTPYDFHATMKDLANLTKISERNTLFVERQDEPFKNRGVSLFLPVPINRTCASAGIDPHWCTCDPYKSMSNSSSLANRAGNFVVKQLNNWLNDYPDCSLFELRNIFIFEKSENLSEVENNFSVFRIVFSVTPGKAEFEATVFRSLNGNLTMSNEISRVNAYAGQSHCVETYSMIKICYCKFQLILKTKNKN